MRSRLNLWLLGAILVLSVSTLAQDKLQQEFKNPPNSAKPRVWWHWMNGNITKEGIKLDLEWMKRAGVGGFQNFDAALNTPKQVENRLVYMTPEWKDEFKYATTLADKLGLEEAIAGSPGWSESGGPWVKPNQGMKKFVWSETTVEGGKPFTGILPAPPSISGPFQTLPIIPRLSALSGEAPKVPQFYADTAVIAYKLPEGEKDIDQSQAKVTSSGGDLAPAVLADGDLIKPTSLTRAPVGQEAWIQFEFPTPQTVRGVVFVKGSFGSNIDDLFGRGVDGPDFQVSDDGQNFRKLATNPGEGAGEHTLSFPAVTARFFRASFVTPPPAPPRREFDVVVNTLAAPASTEYKIAELRWLSVPRVNRFEDKAAFAPVRDLNPVVTSPIAAQEAVAKTDIVDLTSKMSADGTLNWTPPAGRWTILRFGYSLTGVSNHPASPEGTGPEVDKLSREDVKDYMNQYLDNYKSAVGDLMGKRGLQFVISDSYEAGAANWTNELFAEFAKRRGYDMHPWMPVLAGRVVESSESSDRFLWDFRKTLTELIAEYHYDQITEILHQRGMGHYGESHETGRAFIGDGMEAKRTKDVPMAAMWTQKPGVNNELYGYDADIRESASVAHIYGQNLVAAESMTAASGAWAWSPATLKPTADKEMMMGLNRFVIHTSVHQPLLDKKPGISLGPYGQWFTRNETWAESALPWTTYLARSCYLLQQGKFVSDVLYFYGEDSNLTAIFRNSFPDVPAGYNYDYVNADALIHKVSVTHGQLTTETGMSYHLLALDPRSKLMSLPVLRQISKLVEAGAVVVGDKPETTPSLADDQNEFQTLADKLWGSGSGGNAGQGKVYGGQKLESVLSTLKVTPDFEYTKPQTDTSVLFVHRKVAEGDLYFVDNRNDRNESFDATFRVTGKAAELWHPDTGLIEPASYSSSNGRTKVPLHLEPWGTVFVVFRRASSAPSRTLPAVAEQSVATVEGSWDLAFQPDRGAPPKITLDKLTSWTDNSDDGVKYFSGTATYTKTLNASASWFKSGTRLWIDLGDVKNLAEVSVNGKPLGIVWKSPYRVDATSALKQGANTLEIKVTNGWANRIIGDRQPNAPKQYTLTVPEFYRPTAPLWASGLIGPVQMIQTSTASAK